MSIIVETFIMCDFCGLNFGVDFRGRSGKMQREAAKNDGWSFSKGKDKCEECKKRKIKRALND